MKNIMKKYLVKFEDGAQKEFDMLVHVSNQISDWVGISFIDAKAIAVSKRKEAICLLS